MHTNCTHRLAVAMMNLILPCSFLVSLLALSSCKGKSKVEAMEEVENAEAKAMLQGIWNNTDLDEVTLKVSGDTIIYADSTLAPVRFAIIEDSLVLRGYNETRYAIIKQTPTVFQFCNHEGDVIRLAKSTNPDDNYIFENRKPVVQINQNQLIKRDSVVTGGDRKYHVYIQVNPSTYKVIQSSLSQDGLQVDNVYYDNIINVCVYNGAQRLYSSDIHKADFKRFIPDNVLRQCVLSDIVIDKVTDAGVELLAYICEPDSPESYVVRMIVSHSGKLTFSE